MVHIMLLGHLSPQLPEDVALWLVAFVRVGLFLGLFLLLVCGFGHSSPPLLRHLLLLYCHLLLQLGVQLGLLVPLPAVQLGLCRQMVCLTFWMLILAQC